MKQTKKLTIKQCQDIAQNLALKNQGCTFKLCGSQGHYQANWLDPHLGLFTLNGQPGFMMVRDIQQINIWCEEIKATGSAGSVNTEGQ